MGQLSYSTAELNQRLRDTKITPLGGIAVRMINKTGSPSVKGTVVTPSDTFDGAFRLQTDEDDAFGVVFDSGVADGNECWVLIQGVAEVLLADGTASITGNWVIASAVDGRADASEPNPPTGSTISELEHHFKEIGHCMETKSSGTNVLAKIALHFN